MEKIKNTVSAITFLILLLALSVLTESYPLFRLNVIVGITILIFWSLSRTGFAYFTKWECYERDWMIGRKLKNTYSIILCLFTIFFVPLGLLTRIIFFQTKSRVFFVQEDITLH